MEPYQLLRFLYGLFLGGLLVFAGLLTYHYRNEPNYVIGFRIGYTFLSREAWRKANAFGGIALTLLGVVTIALSPFLSTTWLIVVLLLGITVILGVAYLLAKEAYEKEELSEEALEKPEKIIEPPDIRKYLYAQITMITAYLPLLGKAPWELLLIMLFMLFMTFFSGKPLVLQISPRFTDKLAKASAEFMTFLTFLCFMSGVLTFFGAGTGVGVLFALISIPIMFIEMFRFLLRAGEEGYE
ncbi:SdpI family protein [Thermococcus sp. GR6]|uniref:SdpI family protein n=1 Tax=Thermococcus sp. GR6 TaxID=1638256 RepID=UPI0014309EFB|nr:SdpI family protein [Thermococcus sp. GR6]NJE42834.1 SdpI family protein [Thermococcus sp. GR6]